MVTEHAPKTHLSSFLTAVLVCFIVASVATFFRFANLDKAMGFVTDQGRAMLAGRDILLGKLIVTGPETSVEGFHLGPLYYYFTAAALWLSKFHPIGPGIMTAGFGVATALLLTVLLARWRSWSTGLLAGLFFAVSPLAIVQSRLPLEPSPLPFFTLVWLFTIWKWIETSKVRWFLATTLSIIVSVQMNFSAVVFLPITAMVWFWLKAPLSFKLKRGVILAFLALLLFGVLAKSLYSGTTSPEYFWYIWQQLTFPTHSFAAGMFLLIAAVGLWRTRELALSTRVILWSWIALGLSGFLLKKVGGDHSLALFFPLPALLLSLALEPFLTKRLFNVVITIVLISILSLQALPTTFPGPDVYTKHLHTAQQIIELAQEKPYRFVYRGHLDIYEAADDHYEYLLWYLGHPPVKEGDQTPVQQTIVLYFPGGLASDYEEKGERQHFQDVVLEVVR